MPIPASKGRRGHVGEQGAFARAAEKRHVLAAGFGRDAELWLAKKAICMSADGSGVEHGL